MIIRYISSIISEMEDDQKNIESLKTNYQDFQTLIKFMETKLAALLTVEVGMFYFIVNNKILSNSINVFAIIVVLSLLCSITSLLISFLPAKTSNTKNFYYYYSWIDYMPSLPDDSEKIRMLREQCRILAKIINRKATTFRKNAIIFVSIVFMVLIYHSISLFGGK